MSPYHAFSNKPILNSDPNGAVDGDYWKYNSDNKKMEHAGNDGIDDNKNYFLHSGESIDKVTPENYTDVRASLYPDQNVRDFIVNQTNSFEQENRRIETIEGTKYVGTFREVGGFSATAPDGSQTPIPSTLGALSVPQKVVGATAIENASMQSAPGYPTAQSLINGGSTINLIWHIHGDAVLYTTGLEHGGMSNNSKFSGNVWGQLPGEQDYNNAGTYNNEYFKDAGGTAMQISTAGKGSINFYNTSGVTLSIPTSVFSQPLKK
jgi:hypothetical protein